MDPSPPPSTPPPAPEPSPGYTPAPTPSSGKPDHLRRFIAKLIDGFVAAILFWLLVAIIPGWWFASLIGAVVAGAYWIVCDGLDVDFMRHRSLGKKLMGLDVVRQDGRPMDIEASARRNWMFAVSWFYYPAGWILSLLLSLILLVVFIYEVYKVLTEPDAHRWGDELAGTRVVQA